MAGTDVRRHASFQGFQTSVSCASDCLKRHDSGSRLLLPGMQGIHVTAYSPLGSPDSAEMMKRQDKQAVMDNPTVKEVASKHSKAAAEVGMSPCHQSVQGCCLL